MCTWLFTVTSASITSLCCCCWARTSRWQTDADIIGIVFLLILSQYTLNWLNTTFILSSAPATGKHARLPRSHPPHSLSKQLDGTECTLSPWCLLKLQSEMEDLRLGILEGPRLADRAVESVLVWVGKREERESSILVCVCHSDCCYKMFLQFN